MYFFPTNAVYSLKSFISATSNATFNFFLLLLGFGEEDLQGASCSTKMLVFFLDSLVIPEIPEQTSDWEWHKTTRSRVHHVKIHLIILHVPSFSMGFSKKCVRSGPLNLQRQVVRAEGKTRFMKFELFQNSRCHFSQFQIRCNIADSAKMHSTTIWMCRK